MNEQQKQVVWARALQLIEDYHSLLEEYRDCIRMGYVLGPDSAYDRIQDMELRRTSLRAGEHDQVDEEEPEPLMVIHVYREDNGDLLVSEQRFYNHGIHPTKVREQAFADFWEMCADQLDVLTKHEERLGWSLKEQLAYLRQLREMNII